MTRQHCNWNHWPRLLAWAAAAALVWLSVQPLHAEPPAFDELGRQYTAEIQPLLSRYCYKCHAEESPEADLDLSAFKTLAEIRRSPRPWRKVLDMVAKGDMPPRAARQPADVERQLLKTWVHTYLKLEARALADDPGHGVLRRLSNAEYDNTIRDLVGLDLHPAREFPADGAAGEGFTNTGQALVMSPAMLGKYLTAAKAIAAHAVLLPDGVRFSQYTTRRDMTDECLAALRAWYRQYSPDGKLPLESYLRAAVLHRARLASGTAQIDAVAAELQLSRQYLAILWQTLAGGPAPFPLDQIQAKFRIAGPDDIVALADVVRAWQALLWKYNKVGSYMNDRWQDAADPNFVEQQTLRLKPDVKPAQDDVVLYLCARELTTTSADSRVVWRRPRFEGGNQPPLLLRDLRALVENQQVAAQAIFSDSEKYLAAVAAATRQPNRNLADLAAKHGVEPDVLGRWVELSAVPQPTNQPAEFQPDDKPPAPVELLPKRHRGGVASISGWSSNDAGELPIVVANSSDKTEHIPGTISGHEVAVHPTPTHFSAVAWASPIDGGVRIGTHVAHAHPACGNGVAWRLEVRRGEQVQTLAGGLVDLGKSNDAELAPISVHKGDLLLLAIGPRDRSHVCDLTVVNLMVSETAAGGRAWNLARDVAGDIAAANPHADAMGTLGVWQFLMGPDSNTPVRPPPPAFELPRDSVLGRWRDAAADPARQGELEALSRDVHRVLAGPRPDDGPNRVLYDRLTGFDGPLVRGLDLTRWNSRTGQGRAGDETQRLGVDQSLFGHPDGGEVDAASLILPAAHALAVRVSAALLGNREFVVDLLVDRQSPRAAIQGQLRTSPPDLRQPLGGGAACVVGVELQRLDPAERAAGLAAFRACFPIHLYHPKIIAEDEVISLRLFVREDDDLARLFLGEAERQRLDQLWRELQFVSQQYLTEFKNYPVFMGFVSQDGKDSYARVEARTREPVRRRAEEFNRELEAARPSQAKFLREFAARAFRRPLTPPEIAELDQLEQALQRQALAYDEAFRVLLARVLVSPAFLYRVEQPPAGAEPRPVSDWELATRLSYFLWASTPDDELRSLAAQGRLHDEQILAGQARRLLRDPRVRALAVEFACQWLGVRGFDAHSEKSEQMFPTFTAVRGDMYEEAQQYFIDLFQNDRSVLEFIDSDHLFVNEPLAKHYGIQGVAGGQWRRVEGARQHGRGGVLGMAAILTQQSAASRTSPVLRGNWVSEVLLGERLPRPPKDVPRLPESEAESDGLTVRQLVEKHRSVAACAHCHERIDPFGFALEEFDAIGRRRDKDLAGRPVDARAQLRNGVQFTGAAGLRGYLLSDRRDDVLRQFCRKLAGYALGRGIDLADEPLLDEMLAQLQKQEFRFSAAVDTIIRSRQFRYQRGLAAAPEESTP